MLLKTTLMRTEYYTKTEQGKYVYATHNNLGRPLKGHQIPH